MITIEQINFANDLGRAFNALFPKVHPYFVELSEAIAADDVVAFAKFSALLIIELSHRGELIAAEARNWIRLFGNLPEFDLLTQPPSSV